MSNDIERDDDKNYVDEFKQRILDYYDRLDMDSSFKFNCGKTMACFTACCGDVNIFLTPYDVIRMRKRLGMSSLEFLEKYTINPFTKTQKLPSVLMKLRDEDKRCHFVTEEGCSIYEDRPWACRMYPIGLASPREEEGSTEEDFYFLMAEDECLGAKEGTKEWTV
ncbi:MAG: YkgJ family cysteine cluster protein, partial [Victivallales bacterium]|nr:YkgJ family cysteine cluster protein [Victivallales bacterium]